MKSQAADTTKVKVKVFVGVVIWDERIYALSQDGYLYVFDKEKKLQKWMNIKVSRAFGCSISQGRIFCACADG